jgi:hypothetical protein
MDSNNDSQPLDGPFVVENSGFLDLHDLTIIAVTGPMKVGGFVFQGGGIGFGVYSTNLLESGASATFGLSDRHMGLSPMPSKLEMKFHVTFRSRWPRFEMTREFKFHTRRTADGTQRWYPGPPPH